ncbi:MAG: hypothetical protein ACRCVL_07865 [Cetobacterium sp.]
MQCFSVLYAVDVVQSQRYFSLKPGSSFTIPCHYNSEYKQYKKYWCYGRYFLTCEIQAYTYHGNWKVKVIDYRAESFFIVNLDHLQTTDTGWYWCGVEIDGSSDGSEALYITVKSGIKLLSG